MDLTRALVFLPGLVVGLTLHEFAHAWSASLLGDDLARRQGRVSLNPLRHMSLLGTLAIFFLPFGWARPVPVNLYNFRRPRRDYLLTSLAGPLANILFVGVCIGGTYLTRHCYGHGVLVTAGMVLAHLLFMQGALINAILAAVNLIPIPPLDGSKIWPCLIPSLKPAMGGKKSLVFVILLVVLFSTGTLSPAFQVVVHNVFRMIPTSDMTLFDEQFELGSDALDAENFEHADSYFTKALEINPDDAECLYWRAETRLQIENHDGALADLNRAIELSSMIPYYYELRASIYDELGRPDQAMKDWDFAAILRRHAAATDANSDEVFDDAVPD